MRPPFNGTRFVLLAINYLVVTVSGFYQEALQFHADDDVALCALARLYLMTDDLDQCQYSCMTLLRWLRQK